MDALAFHARAIKILRLFLHRAKSPDHENFVNWMGILTVDYQEVI